MTSETANQCVRPCKTTRWTREPEVRGQTNRHGFPNTIKVRTSETKGEGTNRDSTVEGFSHKKPRPKTKTIGTRPKTSLNLNFPKWPLDQMRHMGGKKLTDRKIFFKVKYHSEQW